MYLLQETADNVSSGWDLFTHFSYKFYLRLGIDLASIFVLIRFIYYPSYRTKEFFFTFFIFNLVIFLVTFMMNKVEMSIGASFGLFAVFGIMRYRTEDVSTKDMTYLFLVIAMGLLSAVIKGGWDEQVLINVIILIVTLLLESSILMKKEMGKTISYENIEMIKPENHVKLLEDLKNRTGLNVHRFSITKVDFLRDMAIIRIYYYDTKKSNDISV
jgi:multisubunit Na+/H+ antiporter MnhG subunit